MKNRPYKHRDLSWLGFNARVLQEAKDSTVPLLERLKFLAIYSNNLDEFFRVRVATLKNLIRAGKKTRKRFEFNPKEVLEGVLDEVNRQQEEFSEIFHTLIIPQLADYNIHLIRSEELSLEQRGYITEYFYEKLLPYVQPVLLVQDKIRLFLNNATLYLFIRMVDRAKKRRNIQHAIVQIPSQSVPRFIPLPSMGDRKCIIMLDDLIRDRIVDIFPGYDIIESHSIKLTRDAELYIDDEYSGNLLQKIKESLAKRNVGPASRLVYDREMDEQMLGFLEEMLELEDGDLLPEGRYHNNFDFFKFPDFGMENLKNIPLPPLSLHELERPRSVLESIHHKDYMIHPPYHSYESVCRFFEDAARDPYVTHIKIVQYRVAASSRIMEALIDAVQRGKSVSTFIEVKARFDEEANLAWGEKLEKAGIRVHYSFPGLKVHAKIALIRRLVPGQKAQLYCYLSTGNFHEGTAKVYSDIGIFTSRAEICDEVSRVFSFLETVQLPDQEFKHLLVGQFNLRPRLEAMIDREIQVARSGGKGLIILKMNSLEDRLMIDHLYRASEAGVEVRLIVRGIFCIHSGVKKLSSNIHGISIVDRFLEHARIFYFHNNGDPDLFLSSADWMERNLSRRIEVVFPIYDPDIRNELINILDVQWRDNVKARSLDEKDYNEYRRAGSDMVIRSQHETYYYFKRKLENALHPSENYYREV